MQTTKVFISKNPLIHNALCYIWNIYCLNKNLPYHLTDISENADIVIDETESSDITVSVDFYTSISAGKTQHPYHIMDAPHIVDTKKRPDHLASAFYMINCMQEHNVHDFDELGRYKYENSYQYKFKNIELNLVQSCFDELTRSSPKLNRIVSSAEVKTKFLLSHDIDSINGAWIQDGLSAIKQMQPWMVFNFIFNAIIQKPDWLNMDKIMKMESEYDYRSVFFWLVNKGKINDRATNADYSINNKNVQDVIFALQEQGFENGLHKSISSESFTLELKKLPVKTEYNRYHYLKFTLPQAYYDIENAGIKADASLGFAEAYGFRNSYGRPFRPYNFKEERPFNFIEVPLNIMDGTFQRYLKTPMEETADRVISFFEKNKHNSVISVLWHNTFFSNYKYKGYSGQYKKILQYLYDSAFENTTMNELLKKY